MQNEAENENVRDPEVFRNKVYLFMDFQKSLWMQTFSWSRLVEIII